LAAGFVLVECHQPDQGEKKILFYFKEKILIKKNHYYFSVVKYIERPLKILIKNQQGKQNHG
jgi:hypothetical protein